MAAQECAEEAIAGQKWEVERRLERLHDALDGNPLCMEAAAALLLRCTTQYPLVLRCRLGHKLAALLFQHDHDGQLLKHLQDKLRACAAAFPEASEVDNLHSLLRTLRTEESAGLDAVWSFVCKDVCFARCVPLRDFFSSTLRASPPGFLPEVPACRRPTLTPLSTLTPPSPP